MKLPDKPEIRQFRNVLKQPVAVVDDQALSCGRGSNAFQKKDTIFYTAGAAKYSAHVALIFKKVGFLSPPQTVGN